jgi:hypothetical protein
MKRSYRKKKKTNVIIEYFSQRSQTSSPTSRGTGTFALTKVQRGMVVFLGSNSGFILRTLGDDGDPSASWSKHEPALLPHPSPVGGRVLEASSRLMMGRCRERE